nr:AAA family ATPase [Candidatus Venteria ishoeyi]
MDRYGEIFFLPYRSHSKKLPLHFTSSTVKTLFGLVFYLEHSAQSGDCLMIDEPELNLHPDNQRNLARLLAQLVKNGIKVVVSTHSTYLVRELNNLIMLHKPFSQAEALRKRYGYEADDSLDPDLVSAYLFDQKSIKAMDIDAEGVIAETFDEVVNTLNQSSNEIYYSSQEEEQGAE